MPTTKLALVTGAAARIGAQTARHLHERGCDVFLHYNSNQQAAEQLADELNENRADSAWPVQADLSLPAEVDRLASTVADSGRALALLVNNASRFYPTAVGQTQAWQWDDLMNSNVRGPYFLVQALLPQLQTAGGCIVNLVDVHAERPMSGHSVYCISKAAMAMMTKSLASELGPTVRVNGVSPGAILWPEHDPADDEKHAILQRTALKRVGEAQDIATAVAYLALDAPYVTGQILAVDGGRSLNM